MTLSRLITILARGVTRNYVNNCTFYEADDEHLGVPQQGYKYQPANIRVSTADMVLSAVYWTTLSANVRQCRIVALHLYEHVFREPIGHRPSAHYDIVSIRCCRRRHSKFSCFLQLLHATLSVLSVISPRLCAAQSFIPVPLLQFLPRGKRLRRIIPYPWVNRQCTRLIRRFAYARKPAILDRTSRHAALA